MYLDILQDENKHDQTKCCMPFDRVYNIYKAEFDGCQNMLIETNNDRNEKKGE